MTLLIVDIMTGTDSDWKNVIAKELPDLEIRFWPDIKDPKDIKYLAFGRPNFDELPELPIGFDKIDSLELLDISYSTLITNLDSLSNCKKLKVFIPPLSKRSLAYSYASLRAFNVFSAA